MSIRATSSDAAWPRPWLPRVRLEVARRICRALASRPVILDHPVSVTVSASLGLASAANSGYALRQLLIDADAALYRAKEGGRNQVAAHSPDVDSRLRN